ncbi:MAG: hypothetical protein QW728_02685 [Thermoplasmata archaeon]
MNGNTESFEGLGLSTSTLKKKKPVSLGEMTRSKPKRKEISGRERKYLIGAAAILLFIAFVLINAGVIRFEAFFYESIPAAAVYVIFGLFGIYILFISAYELLKLKSFEAFRHEESYPTHFRVLREVAPVSGGAFLISSSMLFTFFILQTTNLDGDEVIAYLKISMCLLPAVILSIFLFFTAIAMARESRDSRKVTSKTARKLSQKKMIDMLSILFLLYFIFLTFVFPDMFKI